MKGQGGGDPEEEMSTEELHKLIQELAAQSKHDRDVLFTGMRDPIETRF